VFGTLYNLKLRGDLDRLITEKVWCKRSWEAEEALL